MADPAEQFRVGAHIRVHPVDDGAIVFDERAGHYAQANLTAYRVLEGVAAGRSIPEIVDGLLVEFEVQRAVVERDVAQCVSGLSARGWLRVGR